MARWTEEQERWMGRGERHGEDERRYKGQRGEEGGWRGRDEERGEYGGEREGWRDPWRRYGQEEGESGSGRGFGERWRGQGGGGERWRGEREWPYRGSQGGTGGMDPYAGGRGGMYGSGEYRGEYGIGGYAGGGYGRGDYPTYGASAGESGYGRDEWRRQLGREPRHYRPEERGTMERMGDKLKEGMRKLTGRGPKGYRRSDDRIRDDVSERIARSWVNAENVEVKVEKGEVTLTGFVESRDEKREVEDIAEDVFGVEEVHNHLRLHRGEQAGLTAGTGTTGTGASMSGQQAGKGAGSTQPGQTGRH